MTAPPSAPDLARDADRLAAEPPTVCLNCDAALPGDYCPDCGQRAQTLRTPLHRFLGQMAVEFFGIDGRVWRTLGALLFRPGALTAAYLQGRRRRYLSPLRVYLVATVAFFVTLALLDPVGRLQQSVLDGSQDVDPDSVVTVGAHLTAVEAEIAAEPGRQAERERRADSLSARLDALRSARDSSVALPVEAAPPDVPSDIPPEALAERLEAAAEARAERLQAAADARAEALEAAADARAEALEAAADARGDGARQLQKWEFEAAMLRALPSDSLIRLADLREARAQVYPDVGGDRGNVPDWIVRSRAAQRFVSAKSGTDMTDAASDFARETIARVPTVLFLILPVFALLLKLLYVRRGWYYSEHLVFGLHTHAFAFVVFTVVALLSVFAGGAGWGVTRTPEVTSSNPGWLSLLLMATIPIYFLIAQRRVYGQGWVKTVLKSVVLGSAYNLVLVGGLVAAFLLAAALG